MPRTIEHLFDSGAQEGILWICPTSQNAGEVQPGQGAHENRAACRRRARHGEDLVRACTPVHACTSLHPGTLGLIASTVRSHPAQEVRGIRRLKNKGPMAEVKFDALDGRETTASSGRDLRAVHFAVSVLVRRERELRRLHLQRDRIRTVGTRFLYIDLILCLVILAYLVVRALFEEMPFKLPFRRRRSCSSRQRSTSSRADCIPRQAGRLGRGWRYGPSSASSPRSSRSRRT